MIPYGRGVDGCADPSCKPPSCEWPPPRPKHYTEAGVKCAPFPPVTCRKVFTLPSQPTFVVDPHQPIIVDWPPKPEPVTEYVETGPRPDLLAMIPDQIAPQVVTLMAAPQFVNPGGTVTAEPCPHPYSPDGAVHLSIEPNNKPKQIEIRLPEREPGIRGPPCRPWTQCVENTLINDQVRRPLARCCHKRQMPAIVLPCSVVDQLKAKATETERKCAEREERYRARECQRLASRRRQGEWNFTVESLLERKHRRQREKEEGELESTRQLLQEVTQEKKAASEAQIARAKQLMLYRKGLIRDFHSALAYSKMMQEIEESKSKGGDGPCGDECYPMIAQRCYKKMMYPNQSRCDYQSQVKEKKKCSQKLIDQLKCIEERERDQKEEINNELCAMKTCIAQNMPPLPEKYIKYMAEPKCDDGQVQRKQQEMRCDIFYEIQDKLKLDAFIESHEKEIDRQACEFNVYKQQVDAIRKAKEKQLIDDKVAYNIKKSDAATAVLVSVQAKKKGRAAEYDRLKDEWDAEWEDKRKKKNTLLERRKDRVYDDYERRKRDEGWSRRECGLHVAREWGKERLLCGETFEMECDQKTNRRRADEENVLYNKAQASHRHCVEQRQKYMDDVWAAKAKQEYVEEMKEMKSYAQKCIDDWKAKGRSTLPMHQAMKKWDYDAGMQPFLFCSGDAPIYLQVQKQMAAKNKKSNCAEYETTSSRLGFGSGGCGFQPETTK